MIVFLDACARIYRVEEVVPCTARLVKLLADLRRKHAGLQLAVSRLSYLECRVQPLRDGDEELAQHYGALFGAPGLHVVEIDANIIEGAQFGLRTPDAIQVASYLSLDVEHIFLTNDAAFRRVPALALKMF